MQLSVKALMSESLGIILDNVGEVIKSIGWFFLFVIGGSIVAIVFTSLSMVGVVEKLKANDYGTDFEDIAVALEEGVIAISDLYGVFFAYFLLFLVIGFVMSQIFNKWVRIGAFGPARRHFKTGSDSFKAASLNFLKFTFLFIMLGLIMVVVSFVMNKLGLGPTLMEQLTATQEQQIPMAIAAIPGDLVNLVISSAVYAYFSANLTGTALGSDKEGLETPYIKEFALALIGLYLILYIPFFLISLTGSLALMMIVQLTLGFCVSFAISIAHGVRYRMCRPAHEGVAYNVTGQEAIGEDAHNDQDQNSSNGPWG